jgi:hypothetical protein
VNWLLFRRGPLLEPENQFHLRAWPSDWYLKASVAEVRAELMRRGLPQHGYKQELHDKLKADNELLSSIEGNTSSTNADWQSWKHKRRPQTLSLSNDSLTSHPKCDSSYGNAPSPVLEYCQSAIIEMDLLPCFISVSTATNRIQWHSLCVENPDESRFKSIVFASEPQIFMQISTQIYFILGRIQG